MRLLSSSWLRHALFSPSCKSARQTACQMLEAMSMVASRKRQILDMLTRWVLRHLMSRFMRCCVTINFSEEFNLAKLKSVPLITKMKFAKIYDLKHKAKYLENAKIKFSFSLKISILVTYSLKTSEYGKPQISITSLPPKNL